MADARKSILSSERADDNCHDIIHEQILTDESFRVQLIEQSKKKKRGRKPIQFDLSILDKPNKPTKRGRKLIPEVQTVTCTTKGKDVYIQKCLYLNIIIFPFDVKLIKREN